VDLLSGLLDNFHKNRWPVWEVIQWNDEVIESFEIDDMWMLPEDMEEEEVQTQDVEMSPY